MKIRWALCEPTDVDKFRAILVCHTTSIQVLLEVIQMFEYPCHFLRFGTYSTLRANAEKQKKKQDDQNKTIIGMVQQSYFGCMQYLEAIAKGGKVILDLTSQIL